MATDDFREKLDEMLQEWRQNPRSTFTKIGQDSSTWFHQALQLRRGAELLVPDMLRSYSWSQQAETAGVLPRFPLRAPVYGAYTLLSALSLELLAKAVLIERDPTRVQDGRLRRWPDNGHGLLGLLREVGIQLDDEDAYLAERLTECIEWAGRYPIPWNAEAIAPRQTPQGEWASPGNFLPDRDPARMDRIWEHLKRTLLEEWSKRDPLLVAAWHAIETGELPGLGRDTPSTD